MNLIMYLEKLLSVFEIITRITIILIDSYDTKILYTGKVNEIKVKDMMYQVLQVYLERDDSYTILVKPGG